MHKLGGLVGGRVALTGREGLVGGRVALTGREGLRVCCPCLKPGASHHVRSPSPRRTCVSLQAVCAIAAPFLVEAALRRIPKLPTRLLLAALSSTLALASAAMLPAAAYPPFVMFACGAVAGAAYSSIEVLIFHHAAAITTSCAHDLAIDLGAMLYTFFYCVGNALGGLVGGAVVHAPGHLPVLVSVGVSSAVLLYGGGLSLSMPLTTRSNAVAESHEAASAGVV